MILSPAAKKKIFFHERKQQKKKSKRKKVLKFKFGPKECARAASIPGSESEEGRSGENRKVRRIGRGLFFVLDRVAI